ncbi:MAG: Cobalamin biosynthesis protein BluB @ 5,6-dimethylbenzimidazole synthase, flavin destructase family, partial [uncultured Solirubrobacteraceae bacterium]
ERRDALVPAGDACGARSLPRGTACRRPPRLALRRRRARHGPPRDRRAPRHPPLPARSRPRRDPRARAARRAPRAVRRAHAAVAADRHPRWPDAHRDPRRRRARAPAPGRPLRRPRAPVSRSEDRGHRRGAARRLRLLPSRPARRGDPRPRHDPRDRRLLDGLRDPEPVARRPRRGARRRLGELLQARRPARDPRHPGAGRPDRVPVRRLARRAAGAAGPRSQRLGRAAAARARRDGRALGARSRARAGPGARRRCASRA